MKKMTSIKMLGTGHGFVFDIYKGKLNKLNIKNLILYHTEETHMDNRRELYINEGKQYFSNNIIVPDEMEEFEV